MNPASADPEQVWERLKDERGEEYLQIEHFFTEQYPNIPTSEKKVELVGEKDCLMKVKVFLLVQDHLSSCAKMDNLLVTVDLTKPTVRLRHRWADNDTVWIIQTTTQRQIKNFDN